MIEIKKEIGFSQNLRTFNLAKARMSFIKNGLKPVSIDFFFI